MQQKLKAFEIKIGDKILDYRLGKNLDINQVGSFFEKSYKVIRIWPGGRHILGVLEKNNKEYFLKLSTSEGISYLTKNEYQWNDLFNLLNPRKSSNYWVPQNQDSGLYKKRYFYLVTDHIHGEAIYRRPQKGTISTSFAQHLPNIIEFSELIQKLRLAKLGVSNNNNHQEAFLAKTKSWFQAIPPRVITDYRINRLFDFIKNTYSILQCKPRHGDFTPWHIIKLTNKFILIDGEHAMSEGVEYYDIGYFIQRVFCELNQPSFAKEVLSILVKNKYSQEKLIIILMARAIGGFLDESLKEKPNYNIHNQFQNWIISLT